VHNVSDVRQIEIHTAESLVPVPSHLEVEIGIAKLKKYKSLGSDQITAELIRAGGEKLLSVIHKLINSLWNKEKLLAQWKKSIIRGHWVYGCGGSTAFLLPYRNATKIFLQIFNFKKNISYFKILISLRTCITYNTYTGFISFHPNQKLNHH
jgi:hypothetical protein